MKIFKRCSLGMASLLLLLMTAGCSGAASTETGKHEKSKEVSAPPAEQTVKPPKKQSIGQRKAEPVHKDTAPKQNSNLPFIPIEAAKGSKPLKTHYAQDTLSGMPVREAHGGTRKRSVPFGQTLLNGKPDNSDGPLQNYRIVSFYGDPDSPAMGILGQLKPDELITKLKSQAQAYANLDIDHPVIPALELVTTIAQRSAGSDGLYVQSISNKEIEKYVKLTKENGVILILDVELGRDSIMHQVQSLESYLKLPNVYLAIDTEFHVHQGQVPGKNLGHVDGRNVQQAVQYVSGLIKKNHLPDKVVVVHQFRSDIIRNKQAIHPTKQVEVVLNGDGFDIPGIKMNSYRILVRNQPIQYGGFKLFFKLDTPMLTPKQTLTLDPAPAYISYE